MSADAILLRIRATRVENAPSVVRDMTIPARTVRRLAIFIGLASPAPAEKVANAPSGKSRTAREIASLTINVLRTLVIKQHRFAS